MHRTCSCLALLLAMTSSGGADDRSPAAPRAVVEDLTDVRDCAAMLHNMLEGSPTLPGAQGRVLLEGMMSSLSSALSALSTGGGGASSSAGGRGSGGRRKKATVSGGPHRRSSSSCRRRTLSPFVETVTTTTLDDGHAWRKYGQKLIQDSTNPRSYYRCTHKPDQGCKATRQVQISEANPSEYMISYFGQHTCRDPSTIPLVIEAAAPPDCTNFISFGSSTVGATTASAHTAPHGFPFTRDRAVHPMMLPRFVGYSSSLPAQERYGSEEALSSSSPAGQLSAVVVGSAGMASSLATVGSAPDCWQGGASDMAGGNETGSLPSSPSSLGFITGSFGSFGNGGDDDLFGFDP